jgi:hypothetical protein
MVAKDDGEQRIYSQLMNEYHKRLEALAAELPHRDPSAVGMIGRNLAIILWSDLSPALAPCRPIPRRSPLSPPHRPTFLRLLV